MIAFLTLWGAMVAVARSYGRFPPELFFGITIYYATIIILCIFVVCGVVAFLSTKSVVRWCVILAGVLGWLLWLWPSFDSRPFAMPAFFVLGTTLLIFGTGFGVPSLRRHLDRCAEQESKMENKSCEATGDNVPS
jgi:Na+/melibiose symporter-like transporter